MDVSCVQIGQLIDSSNISFRVESIETNFNKTLTKTQNWFYGGLSCDSPSRVGIVDELLQRLFVKAAVKMVSDDVLPDISLGLVIYRE